VLGILAAGGGAAWPAPSCAGAHRSRAAARRADGPAPGRSAPRRNAPWVMRSTSWPGWSSRARCASRRMKGPRRPGRNAAHCPGWPLQRQGHPKIVSKTASQKRSSGPTLERRSLCQPSGPDGEGQAKGQARRRAANLCRSTTPIGGKDGRARASYESSPVAMLNPSLCFLHGCPRSS
jgi:hypothetical protein